MADQGRERFAVASGALDRFADGLDESAGSLGSISPWERLAQIQAPDLKLAGLASAHANRMRAAHTGIVGAISATADTTREDHSVYHGTDENAARSVASAGERIGDSDV